MRAITVVGTVILARLLAPADFGVFAVVAFWMSLLVLLGDLGLGASLVQQGADPTPVELGTAWVLQQLLWVPILVVVWVLAPIIGALLPGLGPDFAWQLRIASLPLALAGLRAVPGAMLVRELRFGALASIEVVQHVVFYVVAVVLATRGAGAWSFVLALVTQATVGCILANVAWRRFAGFRFDLQTARRELAFGFSYQVSGLALLSTGAVIPLFGWLGGGVAAIGQLQFANRVGQLAAFFDEIIGRISFPAFSRMQHEPARLGRMVHDSILVATLGVAAMQGWFIAVAPSVIPQVFGEQWSPAVGALQLMCLSTLVLLPVRFLRSMIFGTGRAREGLRLSLLMAATLYAAFPFFVVAMGLAGGGLAFVVAAAVGLLTHARAVRGQMPPFLAAYARLSVIAGVAGVAAWVAWQSIPGLVGLIASAVLFLAIYGGLVWFLARDVLLRATQLLIGRRLQILNQPSESEGLFVSDASQLPRLLDEPLERDSLTPL
jgi:O-antigen/teichoic acid export membrane protein